MPPKSKPSKLAPKIYSPCIEVKLSEGKLTSKVFTQQEQLNIANKLIENPSLFQDLSVQENLQLKIRAEIILGESISTDINATKEAAFKILEKLADNDFIDAQICLTTLYINQGADNLLDEEKSAAYFKKAWQWTNVLLKKNNLHAYLSLVVLLKMGWGCEADPLKANEHIQAVLKKIRLDKTQTLHDFKNRLSHTIKYLNENPHGIDNRYKLFINKGEILAGLPGIEQKEEGIKYLKQGIKEASEKKTDDPILASTLSRSSFALGYTLHTIGKTKKTTSEQMSYFHEALLHYKNGELIELESSIRNSCLIYDFFINNVVESQKDTWFTNKLDYLKEKLLKFKSPEANYQIGLIFYSKFNTSTTIEDKQVSLSNARDYLEAAEHLGHPNTSELLWKIYTNQYEMGIEEVGLSEKVTLYAEKVAKAGNIQAQWTIITGLGKKLQSTKPEEKYLLRNEIRRWLGEIAQNPSCTPQYRFQAFCLQARVCCDIPISESEDINTIYKEAEAAFKQADECKDIPTHDKMSLHNKIGLFYFKWVSLSPKKDKVKHLESALLWFKKSTDLNNDLAISYYARVLLDLNRIKEAFQFLTSYAERGNNYIQYYLGYLYANGYNEKNIIDTAKARYWLNRAINNGNEVIAKAASEALGILNSKCATYKKRVSHHPLSLEFNGDATPDLKTTSFTFDPSDKRSKEELTIHLKEVKALKEKLDQLRVKCGESNPKLLLKIEKLDKALDTFNLTTDKVATVRMELNKFSNKLNQLEKEINKELTKKEKKRLRKEAMTGSQPAKKSACFGPSTSSRSMKPASKPSFSEIAIKKLEKYLEALNHIVRDYEKLKTTTQLHVFSAAVFNCIAEIFQLIGHIEYQRGSKKTLARKLRNYLYHDDYLNDHLSPEKVLTLANEIPQLFEKVIPRLKGDGKLLLLSSEYELDSSLVNLFELSATLEDRNFERRIAEADALGSSSVDDGITSTHARSFTIKRLGAALADKIKIESRRSKKRKDMISPLGGKTRHAAEEKEMKIIQLGARFRHSDHSLGHMERLSEVALRLVLDLQDITQHGSFLTQMIQSKIAEFSETNSKDKTAPEIDPVVKPEQKPEAQLDKKLEAKLETQTVEKSKTSTTGLFGQSTASRKESPIIYRASIPKPGPRAAQRL